MYTKSSNSTLKKHSYIFLLFELLAETVSTLLFSLFHLQLIIIICFSDHLSLNEGAN
jgi:hypothetical protein